MILCIYISSLFLPRPPPFDAKLFNSNEFGPCVQTYRLSGETCDKNNDYSCLPMFTKCNQEGSGFFCRPFSYAGKACLEDTDCPGGEFITTCLKGRCEYIRALDDSCILDGAKQQCGRGSCSTSSWTCVVSPPRTVCSDDTCLPSHYCSSNKGCIAKPLMGEACTGTSGCSDGLACVSGVCINKKAVGAQCSSSEECIDDAYWNGVTCASRKALDATCLNDTECDLSLACIGNDQLKCRPRKEKYACGVGSQLSCESPRLCSCGATSPKQDGVFQTRTSMDHTSLNYWISLHTSTKKN